MLVEKMVKKVADLKTINCINCNKKLLVYPYLKRKYCSYKCCSDHMRGVNSPKYKGNNAGYHAIHIWINKNFDKVDYCEICGSKNKPLYEWANISGKYTRKRKDYKRMCRSCHRKFDKSQLGENHGKSRLTNKQVIEIRNKYAQDKYNQRKLAEKYEVSISAISNILRRKTWKHI